MVLQDMQSYRHSPTRIHVNHYNNTIINKMNIVQSKQILCRKMGGYIEGMKHHELFTNFFFEKKGCFKNYFYYKNTK